MLRKGIAIQLLGALVLGLLAIQTPAKAADCSDGNEAQVMVQMAPTDVRGRGTAGWNFIKNRELDPACVNSASSAAFSTIHVHNTGFTQWVEVGWVERWDGCVSPSGPCAGKKWDIFVEGSSAGGTGFGGFETGPAIPAIDIGTWDRFKVDNVRGTNQWTFYWAQDSAGGTLDQICWGFLNSTCQWDAGFEGGYVFGETGRKPANGSTGATDHFMNLTYKSCTSETNCSWQSWQNSANPTGGSSSNIGFDTIDGYAYSSGGPATDEYSVVPCSPTPC